MLNIKTLTPSLLLRDLSCHLLSKLVTTHQILLNVNLNRRSKIQIDICVKPRQHILNSLILHLKIQKLGFVFQCQYWIGISWYFFLFNLFFISSDLNAFRVLRKNANDNALKPFFDLE